MSLEISIDKEVIFDLKPYKRKIKETWVDVDPPKPCVKLLEPPTDPPESYCKTLEQDFGDYDSEGKVMAMLLKEDYISRCRYGALVLNTKDVFIADVDIKENSSLPQLRSKQEYKQYFLRMTSALLNDFALYETHSGFRVIMVSDVCNPQSELSKSYMELFLADKLYASCCIEQDCYRARLTPKPTRVGLVNLDKAKIVVGEDWVDSYEETIADYAVCKLAAVTPKMEPLRYADKPLEFLVVHDKFTLNSAGGLA